MQLFSNAIGIVKHGKIRRDAPLPQGTHGAPHSHQDSAIRQIGNSIQRGIQRRPPGNDQGRFSCETLMQTFDAFDVRKIRKIAKKLGHP